MLCNNSLSIVVPTYNRAKSLDVFFEKILPAIIDNNVGIYISDNASTDDTELVVNKWMLHYNNIFYTKNIENVGMDKNFEIALKSSSSDYAWLIGDTYMLSRQNVDSMIEVINTINIRGLKVDSFIVNVGTRVLVAKEKEFSKCNELLIELGWHSTCIAANIFSRRLINECNFSRYYNTELVHVGALFEYFASSNYVVMWLPNINVTVLETKRNIKNGWMLNALKIWLVNWPNLIYSLPPIYDIHSKSTCIKLHNSKTIFSIVGLLYLRMNGIFNFQSLLKYRRQFSSYTSMPFVLLTALSILPSSLIRFLRQSYLNYRRF